MDAFCFCLFFFTSLDLILLAKSSQDAWHHFYEAFAGFRISETKKKTNDKEKEDKITGRNNKDYFRKPAADVTTKKNELEG